MIRKKVLVVDDDPNLIKALTVLLKKEGYDIDTATDGEEAIEKVQEVSPKVMFLDIMMPKKDGFEVCQEVKGSPDTSDTYIIMLSAKAQEEDVKKGIDVGADEYITKPYSIKQILEKVQDLME